VFNHLNVSHKRSQEKNMFVDNFGTSYGTSGTGIGATIQFDYNTKTSTSEKEQSVRPPSFNVDVVFMVEE